ncbi:MAG TPA: hypothetical protein VMH86_13365 [Rhizomicrobium sp.]|nr:hypothetical protein [Rhizomicrobium sp.]
MPGLPSRAGNIDTISIREMIPWPGGFSFLGGAILLAAGRIARAIRPPVSSAPPAWQASE